MNHNKVILKESQLRKMVSNVVRKALNEAMDDTFSYEELSSKKSFAAKVRYCKEHCGGPIGNGSSRMVFQIDDEKCLKLAKNPKGIAQNGAEFDWYAQNYGVLPKIYESAEDNSWIVSEYVLTAKAQDFKVCLGIDFQTFCTFVKTVFSFYCRRGDQPWGELLYDDEFENLVENNEWLDSLYHYMSDYQTPYGDIIRLSNLGMVQRDGQPEIVILDNGLTDEIWSEYYS